MPLRVLGIITARGGSKGIPRKNIKDLCGKPLLAWTLDAVKASTLLTRCILSTDDLEIAEIGRRFGADVPFMRPAELAGDKSTSISVVQDALQKLKAAGEEYDAVMILQPTSPLRTGEDIDACIRKMEETGADSVMSMMKLTDFSPKKLKRMEGDRILPLVESEGQQSDQRQASPDVYKRNCAVYLTRVPFLLNGDLFGTDSRGVVMPADRSVDINVPLDFEWAEFYMKKLGLNGNV